MYRVLIAPVRQRLDGCEVVYISADGALLQIPFQAALKDETTALIDEVAVAYTPGIAVLRGRWPAAGATQASRFSPPAFPKTRAGRDVPKKRRRWRRGRSA